MSIRGKDEYVYRYREEGQDERQDADEDGEKPRHCAPGGEKDAPNARAREERSHQFGGGGAAVRARGQCGDAPQCAPRDRVEVSQSYSV